MARFVDIPGLFPPGFKVFVGRKRIAAEHGTLSRYTNQGCRCAECVSVGREYQRRRYAARRSSGA